jgi:nicotinamidase-related amidase
MLIEADETQLLLMDYQSKLMPQMVEADLVLSRAMCLAQTAHILKLPIWGTEQYPQGLGKLAEPLAVFCRQVVSKNRFSAVDTEMLDWLRPTPKPVAGNARSLPKHLQKPAAPAAGRNTIVLAGCEAHVCLLQTALELMEEEFDVWVVTDACSSRTERNRDAAFDRLAGAGVELVTTEMVIFEWLRESAHPNFRQILELIKLN